MKRTIDGVVTQIKAKMQESSDENQKTKEEIAKYKQGVEQAYMAGMGELVKITQESKKSIEVMSADLLNTQRVTGDELRKMKEEMNLMMSKNESMKSTIGALENAAAFFGNFRVYGHMRQ